MDEYDAKRYAEQIGVASGDHIFLQSDGQIMNPHPPNNHVDGWKVSNIGGTYVAEKIHSQPYKNGRD